ncbi:resuscitation-promoting factor protein RpfC [Streptomyces gulbargensis]|uniref:Resuscitation-promoting factor protein RpfC n=2 Tax=Streptomyces gulbargensis TaxID=364901 RepID=A0ABP7MS60_9ACTN
MALPLLATGSASAADAATWDRVAECESGGQWSANFGNGMYGGLQFTQESWERHGGLAYAPSADLASRAQQIVVAEKALASGATDWATCAPIAGLGNDGKAPGVNPGPAVTPPEESGPAPESNRTAGTPTASPASPTVQASPSSPATSAPAPRISGVPAASPAPDAPTASRAPGAAGTAASTHPAVPGASTHPAAPSAPTAPGASDTPGTSGTPEKPRTAEGDAPSSAPGTGKHRGEAAPEETGKTDTSAEAGRHAAPADKSPETPAKAPTADAPTVGADATDSQDTSDAYTVRPGDNLTVIAQERQLPGGWTALYDANRRTVGTDPDLILPGQSLDLTIGSTPAGG